MIEKLAKWATLTLTAVVVLSMHAGGLSVATAADNPALGIGEPNTNPDDPDDPPPCPGPTCDCPDGSGSPVYVMTGTFFRNFIDLEYRLSDRLNLRIWRTYNSDEFYVGYFGRGVSSMLEMLAIPTFRGQLDDEIVVVHWPDGRRSTFTRQPDQSYTNNIGDFETLTKEPGGFRLREREGTIYEFDEGTRLLRMADPDGNDVTFSYDANGRPETITLFNNRDIDISYNANGLVDTISDFAGRSVSYTYDEVGNLISFTDADSHTWMYGYDETTGKFASITTPLGDQILSLTYDAQGRVRDLIDEEGSFTYTYNNGNTFKQDNQYDPGVGWRFFYNTGGQVTRVDRPDGVTVNNVFNGLGQQTGEGNGLDSWTYVFDENNNVLEATDPVGATTTFTYEPEFNQVMSRTNDNGIVTMYEYGVTGLRTREIRAFGLPEQKEQTWTYNPDGTLASHTDFRGNTETYLYDANHFLSQFTDREDRVRSYMNDGLGNVLTITDPLLNTSTYTYDGHNRVLTHTDERTNTTTTVYDAAGRVASRTDRRGNTTEFEYDAFGRTTAIVQPAPTKGAERPRTEMTYDSHGWMTQLTDPNDVVTTYDYNEVGYMTTRTKVSAAGDVVTTWTHNALGGELTAVDTAAGSSTFAYDDFNRLTSRTRDLGGRMETEGRVFNLLGLITSESKPNGQVRTTVYDVLDQPTTLSDQIGVIHTLEFNANGTPTNYITPEQEANYVFNDVEQPMTHTDRDGRMTTFHYNDRGDLTRVDYPGGRSRLSTYDAAGNLMTAAVMMGGVTVQQYTYEYDENNNMAAIINPDSVRTEMDYDALNRMIERRYAAGTADERTETYAYDDGGNMTSKTLRDGSVISYTYDDQNRLVSVDYPGTDFDATYTYGADGRLATAGNSSSMSTFSYSFGGRQTQQTTDGRTITVDSNVSDRTVTITYPSGRQVVRQYDVRDRLTSVEVDSVEVASYTYDLTDRVISRTYANTTSTDYGWDARGLVVSVDHQQGGGSLYRKSFGIDNDDLTRFERNELSSSTSRGFGYDEAKQITDYRVGMLDFSNQIPNPSTQSTYTYDDIGRLTNRVDDASPSIRTYDALDQVTSVGGTNYTHDARGNLTNDGEFTYAYDFENRLISVTRDSDSAVMAEYVYDAMGNLVETVDDGGVSTHHVSILKTVVEERDDANQIEREYVYNRAQSPILMYDGGTTPYYYHEDGRHNVIALTDGSGATVDEYSYTPFGRTDDTSSVGNPFQWGAQRTGVNGWLQMRYRSYSPELARFVQIDPIDSPMGGGSVYQMVTGRSDDQLAGWESWSPSEISRQLAGPKASQQVHDPRISDPSLAPLLSAESFFTIQNRVHVANMGQPGNQFMGLRTPDREARYGYGGNNPVDNYDPDGELWTPASGGVSFCAGSACAASVCLGSACGGSGCGGSACGGSGCGASGCVVSGCAGSGCGASGCAGSACGGSACGASGCAGSFCGGSACIGSACAGSLCTASGCIVSGCGGSACVGSVCGGSGCVGSGCGGSGCGNSVCFGSGCIGSGCMGTGCGFSACSGSGCSQSGCSSSCGGSSCPCSSTFDPDFLTAPEEMLAALDVIDAGGDVVIRIASRVPQWVTFDGQDPVRIESGRMYELDVGGESAFELSIAFLQRESVEPSRIEFAGMLPVDDGAARVSRNAFDGGLMAAFDQRLIQTNH